MSECDCKSKETNKKTLEEKLAEFEQLKGRVSFLRQIKSNVTKVYEGEKIGNLKFFKVYPDIMKGIQNTTYLKVYSYTQFAEILSLFILYGLRKNTEVTLNKLVDIWFNG